MPLTEGLHFSLQQKYISSSAVQRMCLFTFLCLCLSLNRPQEPVTVEGNPGETLRELREPIRIDLLNMEELAHRQPVVWDNLVTLLGWGEMM